MRQASLILFAVSYAAAGSSGTQATNVAALSSRTLQSSSQGAVSFDNLGSPIQLVVLACKRPLALRALLTNLDSVGESGGYEGHSVPLLISIDVPRTQLTPPVEVVALANEFEWKYGEKTVKIQEKHQGIIGQWLNLRATDANPWMAVLEDDLAVSPCFYSYLLRARQVFGDREDVSGFTLQKHGPCLTEGEFCAVRDVPMDRPYLVRCVGSWGFMPTPSSWKQFVEWQAAHNMTKPTANLPKQLVHHKWYEEFVANDKLDSFWTIWHLAYTHAVGKATLVAELPEPLALPHGQQPSEHGNEPGRPGMVASLRADERSGSRTPNLGRVVPATPRPASLGPYALNLAQTTLEMETAAARHRRSKAAREAWRERRERRDLGNARQLSAGELEQALARELEKQLGKAGTEDLKAVTAVAAREEARKPVVLPSMQADWEEYVGGPEDYVGGHTANALIADEDEESFGCCVADESTSQAGGDQTCINACKPGQNCCGPCGCKGCPHLAAGQLVDGYCMVPAKVDTRLPTIEELGLCTQCDAIRDPASAFWSAKPIAFDYDGRRMAWPPSANSTNMPSLNVSLELVAKQSRLRLALEAPYAHEATTSHHADRAPLFAADDRRVTALVSGRDDSRRSLRILRDVFAARTRANTTVGGSPTEYSRRRPELLALGAEPEA